MAAAVGGWSGDALQVGYRLSYWLQMGLVLSFLVILPLGEHFHIVTALPTLYFRRERVWASMDREGKRAQVVCTDDDLYDDAIFKEGKPYRGETQILDIPYFTAYDPIRNASGQIVGVLFGVMVSAPSAPVPDEQRADMKARVYSDIEHVSSLVTKYGLD